MTKTFEKCTSGSEILFFLLKQSVVVVDYPKMYGIFLGGHVQIFAMPANFLKVLVSSTDEMTDFVYCRADRRQLVRSPE